MVLRFYFIVLMFDRIMIRLSARGSKKNVLSIRLQNNVFFSSKSVKKSVKRSVRVSHARKVSEAREKKPSISIAYL